MNALKQSFAKPYFHFNPKDDRATEFANRLIADLGDYDIENSDAIINIGGDGTILRAVHVLEDRPSFAVRPPGSNSTLYHGHHNIENGIDLQKAFAGAVLHEIHPLKADICMSNGEQKTIYAYADIVARSFNAQAVLSMESLDNAKPQTIMGCGWIVATPMGSTALNETRGGKILEMGAGSNVITIDGVTNTTHRKHLASLDYISRIVGENSRFTVELSSVDDKRLSSIDFDADTMLPDGQIIDKEQKIFTIDLTKGHIESFSVTTDFSQSRQVLLNPEYLTPRP